MKNCLVTQLKGNVNNDNLPIYDGFVFEIDCTGTSQENPRFYISTDNDNPIKISVVGGANRIKVYDSGDWTNEITFSESSITVEVSKTEKFKIKIIGKYGMSQLYTQNITPANDCIVNIDPIEAYKYSDVVNYNGSFFRYGYVNCADFLTFKKINDVTTIYGLKGSLSILSNLTYTSAVFSSNEEIIGTLKDFPVTITNINITNATKINGDFVDLVKHQRKLGRTTGSITIKANTNKSRITFNGNVLTDGDDTLSWDASTITWAGTTIQNSDVEP